MKTVRVMSHNVWGMYAKDVVKKSANRPELMKKVYFKYLPDVIGTQEFSADIYENRLPELIDEHYTQLDVAADVAAAGVAHQFTPVFYRRDRVEPIKSGFFLYDRAFNNSDSKSITYATFRLISGGGEFSVCNTHFWWRSGPEHDTARVINATDILSIAGELTHPVIIMGDLNCLQTSEAYKTLVAGGMCDVRYAAPDTTEKKTHHPYPIYDEEREIFTPAPYDNLPNPKSIDYIFIDIAHAKTVKKFDVLTDADALSTSDHCPIYVDFEM